MIVKMLFIPEIEEKERETLLCMSLPETERPVDEEGY